MCILQNCVYKIEETVEFAQQNGLANASRNQIILKELQNERLNQVQYAICKSQARMLILQARSAKTGVKSAAVKMEDEQIETGEKNKKT